MLLDHQCRKCKQWYLAEYDKATFDKIFLDACKQDGQVLDTAVIECPFCKHKNREYIHIIGHMFSE